LGATKCGFLSLIINDGVHELLQKLNILALKVLKEAIVVKFTKISILRILALQVVEQFLELIEISLDLVLLNDGLFAFGFFLLIGV
jgi:hypothetical protein